MTSIARKQPSTKRRFAVRLSAVVALALTGGGLALLSPAHAQSNAAPEIWFGSNREHRSELTTRTIERTYGAGFNVFVNDPDSDDAGSRSLAITGGSDQGDFVLRQKMTTDLTCIDNDTMMETSTITGNVTCTAEDVPLIGHYFLRFVYGPDHEAPSDSNTDNSYVVKLTATSGESTRVQTSVTTLTVLVINWSEPPTQMNSPGVVPTSDGGLTVSWSGATVPQGAPPVTGYEVGWKQAAVCAGVSGGNCIRTSWNYVTDSSFTITVNDDQSAGNSLGYDLVSDPLEDPLPSTTRTVTIDSSVLVANRVSLEADHATGSLARTYQVAVRAVNVEAGGEWSNVVRQRNNIGGV